MPKVKNREQLIKKILALPEVQRAAIRKEMEAGANKVTDLMFHLAPVDSDFDPRHRPGALRGSIGWVWGKIKKGQDAPGGTVASASEIEGQSGVAHLTIYAGSKEVFWGRWVEFGTEHSAAEPFFYSAWHLLRAEYIKRIRLARQKAIRELARKQ